MDDTTALLLGYRSGAMAELACSFATELPAHAELSGSAGRLELPAPFYAADRVVLHPVGGPPRAWRSALVGRGYTYEAREAMRCVRAGLTESPLVPWAATLGVLAVTDEVRDADPARACPPGSWPAAHASPQPDGRFRRNHPQRRPREVC
ncbi:hypothetical protein AB0A69_04740 [Streptomyces sp. NPDC045431]|uniref:hypothetical protein n=1 Tax=Streptomyces sp. NPDC045431 TaxID=3155613 RepID=UPI0033E5F23E